MKEPGAMESNLWLDEGIKSMKRCFKWIGDVTDLTRLSLPFYKASPLGVKQNSPS